MGGKRFPPIPKICHTNLTMMKFDMVVPSNHVTHPMISAASSIFSATFVVSRNTDIDCI